MKEICNQLIKELFPNLYWIIFIILILVAIFLLVRFRKKKKTR